MQATTKSLGLTLSHLLSAIEQAKAEVLQLQQSPDLRTLNEDFREGAKMSLVEFIDIESEYTELKAQLDTLRVIALVRDLDPQRNKVDRAGRIWTAVVRENSIYRVSIPAIKSVREALGLDLHDAKIAVDAYIAGKL